MSLDNQQGLGTSPPRSHPYTSSLSSTASSSTSSIFSVDAASSQTTSSSVSSSQIGWEADEWSSSRPAPAPSNDVNGVNTFAPISRANTYPQYQPAACLESSAERVLPPLRSDLPLPAEQRQHPRRSSSASVRPPPPLVRQCERKLNFVDGLVDSATQMVEVIWPLSVPSSRCEAPTGRAVLPLRTFIQETLRRSRTSYSTLQVALYYLVLIKSHVPKHDFTMQQPEDTPTCRALQCGRRMFLAALILASKYLQDRNYSARAWSKISGLKVCEINTNEMAFLIAVNWKLHIVEPVWDRWQKVVYDQTLKSNTPPSPGAGSNSVDLSVNSWRHLIPRLTPELDIVQLAPKVAIAREGQPEATVNTPLRSPTWHGCSSQETTPTPANYKLPRFLEPKPEMLPPTPILARMGPLPTPNLTPQSIASSTPAASAMAFGSRRTSMCTAMAQAQNASLARTCIDQWSVRSGLEAYQFSGRRPSLAPSTTSSSSSPESMIMDTSSRSSRASSISSVSSAASWAPNQSKLARLATCRSARLPYPAMHKTKGVPDYGPLVATVDAMSSPEIDSLLDDVEMKQFDSPMSMRSTPEKPAKGRKRVRSSVDLQQTVRNLLHGSQSVSDLRGPSIVLPDRSLPVSFLLPSPTRGDRSPTNNGLLGLQSPTSTVAERRLPIQKDLGRKRSCCSTEAVHTFQNPGPGMWKGIL